MKAYLLAIGAAIVALAAAIAMHVKFLALSGGYSTWGAYLNAPAPTLQLINGCIGSLFTIAILAWLGWRELRRGKLRTEAELVLCIFAVVVAGVGLDGWLYAEAMMRMASANTGVTSPVVLAPSRAEATLSLVAGLAGATVALAAAVWLHKQAVKNMQSREPRGGE